ncbi:MAG: hypothetical protein ACREA4_11665, partial [Nitrososphaera sp.]
MKILGFEGPYSGGKHPFMVKGEIALRIPNPHQGDIGRELLASFPSLFARPRGMKLGGVAASRTAVLSYGTIDGASGTRSVC